MNDLAGFFALAIVVIVTPGPDTALTIRNSLVGGRAAGVATAIGVAFGQATWSLATSLGVAALLGRAGRRLPSTERGPTRDRSGDWCRFGGLRRPRGGRPMTR